MTFTKGVAAVAIALCFVTGAHATTYKFTVVCQQRSFVESWETGAIDPGKEYLRAITGTRNPSCSIGDFDFLRDGHLPVNRHSDAGGVLEGFPPVAILRAIFGF